MSWLRCVLCTAPILRYPWCEFMANLGDCLADETSADSDVAQRNRLGKDVVC
jgi:hypothetical protein